MQVRTMHVKDFSCLYLLGQVVQHEDDPKMIEIHTDFRDNVSSMQFSISYQDSTKSSSTRVNFGAATEPKLIHYSPSLSAESVSLTSFNNVGEAVGNLDVEAGWFMRANNRYPMIRIEWLMKANSESLIKDFEVTVRMLRCLPYSVLGMFEGYNNLWIRPALGSKWIHMLMHRDSHYLFSVTTDKVEAENDESNGVLPGGDLQLHVSGDGIIPSEVIIRWIPKHRAKAKKVQGNVIFVWRAIPFSTEMLEAELWRD